MHYRKRVLQFINDCFSQMTFELLIYFFIVMWHASILAELMYDDYRL